MLDGAGVLAVVGEVVAAGVAQHVWVHGEGERGEFAGALKRLYSLAKTDIEQWSFADMASLKPHLADNTH